VVVPVIIPPPKLNCPNGRRHLLDVTREGTGFEIRCTSKRCKFTAHVNNTWTELDRALKEVGL
jgi:hypothetical protein